MSSVALRIGPDALYDFVAKVTFFAFFVFGPVWKFLETMFAFPRVNVSAIYLLCTLVLLLLLLVKAAFSARRLQGKPVFVAISILLLWVLAIQILQFFSLLQQVDWWTLLRYFSNTGVSPILLTLLGKWYAENEEGSARTVRVSWLCSTVIYVFSYFYIGQDFHREIVEASVYLTLSDCYAIVSLLLLVSVRNKTQAALFLAISFWVLFFLNSRFSFIAFVFACMVIMFVRNKLAAIVMVLLAVMVLFLIGPLLVDILGPEHRMVRLFLFESDSSLSGRMVLFQQELEFLRSNWVLGRYMYDVVATGVTGNYAHNYMSFLSAYGIGPAVGLVCVIIASLSGGVRQAMHHHHIQAILAVLCFCLLGIVAARSYLYPYIWFALAALASLRFSVADAKAS